MVQDGSTIRAASIIVDEDIRLVAGWKKNGTAQKTSTGSSMNLFIETKYHKTSASDIIRQIGLYKEYESAIQDKCGYNYTEWCVLTFFDLSDLEQLELDIAKIKWIKMGARFNEWWSKRQNVTQKRSRCEL